MLTTDLIIKLNDASKYLDNNNKTIEANELRGLTKQLQDVNMSKEKSQEIKQNILNRCDVRWLGEIYIKEVKSMYDWWNLLGEIKELAEKL
ncbi:hypothetical protein [Clostridium sp.]|uniref:hypothetical protein n=1 Tax=Clostridium sp. TaxID=1506 RepID=UPI00260D6069|nr:hypothetical protein [uncultured Clostridium sp.]